jgi:XapX domain-containing protein
MGKGTTWQFMNTALAVLALLTGFVTGSVFSYLQIPIPAPPNLIGVLGIIGIYVGYSIVNAADIGFDLLAVLGL